MVIQDPRTETSAAPSGALLLSQAAENLFGRSWQTQIANLLAIDLRTVQRWAAGTREPPQAVLEIVIDLRNTVFRFRHQRSS